MPDGGRVRPAKLAHFVVRTSPERFEEMAAWYIELLEADVVFKNPFSCFMSYDEEHHRVAIIAMPGLADRNLNAAGIDHVAFTYASLGEFVHTYERLARRGVEPAMPLHHGPTLSLSYQDPQVPVFDGFLVPDSLKQVFLVSLVTGNETSVYPIPKSEIFIEKVRIENGYTREEFGMLSQTKIEELLHDPLLIKFMINDDRSMTLNEVEEAIKGWKK